MRLWLIVADYSANCATVTDHQRTNVLWIIEKVADFVSVTPVIISIVKVYHLFCIEAVAAKINAAERQATSSQIFLTVNHLVNLHIKGLFLQHRKLKMNRKQQKKCYQEATMLSLSSNSPNV